METRRVRVSGPGAFHPPVSVFHPWLLAMLILGIDPSLRGTGWGVPSAEGNRLAGIAWGVIHNPPSLPVTGCLREIYRGLAAAIAAHRPQEAAVEALFAGK